MIKSPWLNILPCAVLLWTAVLAGCPHPVGWSGESGGTETPAETPERMSWAEMVAHMEANPETAGPVVYELTPSDEESPPVALRHDSAASPNCPAEVIIEGNGKTVTLTEPGALLTLGQNITLTLRNITLKGFPHNNYPLVLVDGGNLYLEEGGIIRDNKNDTPGGLNGGGVLVRWNGTFSMSGGEIRDNSNFGGLSGGVAVVNDGSFSLSGGQIRNNTARWGGGVFAFTNAGGGVSLTGGTIANNTSTDFGGGMYVEGQGSYVISGNAAITGNTSAHTGGVTVYSAVLEMTGGSIRGNAGRIAGGVYLSYVSSYGSVFNMHGGTIADNHILDPGTPLPPWGTAVTVEAGATFNPYFPPNGTAAIEGNPAPFGSLP